MTMKNPHRLIALLTVLCSLLHPVNATNATNATNAFNATQSNASTNSKKLQHGVPTIYTYFERIPSDHRTTGMRDDEDDQLLELWNTTWIQAGWNPIVLTLGDAQRHSDYESVQEILATTLHLDTWSQVLFHRWVAMSAVGGGWYADYDVFPLHDFPAELPNNGRMTVHDIVSPTLASGSADEWSSTLNALLKDAQTHKSPIPNRQTYWTDSLGVNSLTKTYRKQAPAPLTGKRVAMPYDKNDPVASGDPADCAARNFRGKWAVHFGPKMLQMTRSLSPTLRHPKYRWMVANEWLPRWKELCEETNLTATK
jgi:hypothetical protein